MTRPSEHLQQEIRLCPNRLKEEVPLAIGVLAVWLAGCVVDLYTTAIGTAIMTIADLQAGGAHHR